MFHSDFFSWDSVFLLLVGGERGQDTVVVGGGGGGEGKMKRVSASSKPEASRGASGWSRDPALRRVPSLPGPGPLSKMSQNLRDSVEGVGQGLVHLLQQQRRRMSLPRTSSSCSPSSSSSSSSSSVVSAGGGGTSPPQDAPPDSDPPSAPVVPSVAGRGSAGAGTMRRGTSLQSRRSKGSASGSGSGDRDPLLRGSPQPLHRRNTHDPQQHVSRPRSSSTTEATPSSPSPGHGAGDVVLSSGYQSTEETERVSGTSPAPRLFTDLVVEAHLREFCSFVLGEAQNSI